MTNSQFLQFAVASYPTTSLDPMLSPPTSRQLLIYQFNAINNSASAMTVGMGVRLAPGSFKLYDWAQADISSGGQLFSTTPGEGFYVQAPKPFNGLSLVLSNPATGSPVFIAEYWNGSAWVAMASTTGSAFDLSQAESYIFVQEPIDWATGSGGAVPSYATAMPGYTMRIRATTASGVAVVASAIALTRLLVTRAAVGPGQWLGVRFSEDPMILLGQESIVPFFETADANNSVEVAYRVVN